MDQLRVDTGGFQMNGMAPPPPLMNPPPQIFGSYGPDGMPLLPHDIASQMSFDPSTLLDDTNEAKRRRIAKACDMCRKKKIKCDGKLPSCTHCLNYKTECVFTQVEKKRAPPKGAKYIEGIENRLVRMENVLRLSGLLGEDGDTDLGALEKRLTEKAQQEKKQDSGATSSPTSTQAPSIKDADESAPQSALASPEPARDRSSQRNSAVHEPHDKTEEEVEALSEMMCSLVTNQSGETRYIGSSSGFSIFSPKGIQWVNEKTGDSSFSDMISNNQDDHKWHAWKPEIFGDVFRRPIYRQLPPKHETISLLTDYFENFNPMFPLFHQPTLMHLVERQYSADPYQGSGWWASLNVALAIAHRLRVMSNLVPQEEDDKAWAYLKNAMGVFSELTMHNTDLLSVQALLGMASFLQGTPNPQPSFVLIAAAIRLSHSIGLHKRGTNFNLNPIEVEQRKRVFWIAYMLDKDLCLRSGRPPAQDDDDMNVDLPDPDPADNIGNIPLADGKGKMNLFRVMAELTTIESRVYKRLYSTKATKLSAGELLQTIGELDKELEDWKDNIPIDFRPEQEIKASHTPLILHVVMLHFSYYNALTTIHRMSIHHGYWTSRLSNYAIQGLNTRPLNPRVFSSAALCASAARATISLLKYIPQGDNQCVWLILYFPVAALVTLFGNILQNPLDSRARSDTRLMTLVVTFLSTLGQEAETGGVHRMLGVCLEFERIAKKVIDKAERDSSSRRKRKPQEATKFLSPQSQNRPGSSGATPTLTYDNSMGSQLSPKFNGQQNRKNNAARAALTNHSSNPNSPASTDADQSQRYPASSAGGLTPSESASQDGWPSQDTCVNTGVQDFGSFAEMTGFGQPVPPPPVVPNANSGFQPLLPQDLWQLPMTLDWDWAETFGGAYPSFENGSTMDEGGQ